MKAGDIAITWAPDDLSEFRGLFVELVEPIQIDAHSFTGPGWLVRGHMHCARVKRAHALGLSAAGERASDTEWVIQWPHPWLRPLGDPDAHAVDEIVQLVRRKRAEKAREPDPAYVGQTFYEPGPPPGFVGV